MQELSPYKYHNEPLHKHLLKESSPKPLSLVTNILMTCSCGLCVYIYIYTHSCICMYVSKYVCIYIHTYMHAYICTCLCIIDALGGLFQRVCVCAWIYTDISADLCICCFTCSFAYVLMYIHMHIHTQFRPSMHARISTRKEKQPQWSEEDHIGALIIRIGFWGILY